MGIVVIGVIKAFKRQNIYFWMLLSLGFLLFCSPREKKSKQPQPTPTIIAIDAQGQIFKSDRENEKLLIQGKQYFLNFDGGEKKFIFILKGKPALGIFPHFSFCIDENEVFVTTIDSSEWKEYSISYAPKPGTHRAELKFINDYYDPSLGEDRNLYIKEFSITSNN